MHVHVSVLHGMIIGAYMLIIMFLIRLASVKWSDSTIGKALAFIH